MKHIGGGLKAPDKVDRSKRYVKLRVNGGWRNTWKKLQRRIWAEPPSLNPCALTIFQRDKSLELTSPNVSIKMRYVVNVVPRNVNKHPTVPHRLVNDIDLITSLLLECLASFAAWYESL
ncbi:hypothetical protein CEXT_744771 [Caerostris extrusa]|uniref:Uncharacterized protein n=1 Tax=Caerostris extrusa TaxID=172846 RepID=A0AAV4WIZ0_CAEEX|nr:hypothetical protein CEXT_744771 [Caerostris extrusa]